MSMLALGPVLFCSDPHGAFRHIIEAATHVKASALVLLGDVEPGRPLEEALRSISVDWYFVCGDHDADSNEMAPRVRSSAKEPHNVHGREVTMPGGLRLAGLAGACRESVWNQELAVPLCAFLLAFPGRDEPVYDYVTERNPLESALRTALDASDPEARLSWSFAPAEAYDSGVGIAAMEATWRDQEAQGPGRHHALADARALRAAGLAVEEGAKR